MSKMRKEYDPNKVKRRKRKPIVYIICEGKETETLYFKHFRSRNCLVDIIPIPSKHKAAEHLVKHAKSLISQADYYPKDGDQLWWYVRTQTKPTFIITLSGHRSDQNMTGSFAIFGAAPRRFVG